MPRGPLLQFFDRFWWRQAVFAFGAAGLAWLIVATALEKGISDLDRAVVLGIGLAAAIAFAMTSGLLPGKRRKPKQASPPRDWRFSARFVRCWRAFSGA